MVAAKKKETKKHYYTQQSRGYHLQCCCMYLKQIVPRVDLTSLFYECQPRLTRAHTMCTPERCRLTSRIHGPDDNTHMCDECKPKPGMHDTEYMYTNIQFFFSVSFSFLGRIFLRSNLFFPSNREEQGQPPLLSAGHHPGKKKTGKKTSHTASTKHVRFYGRLYTGGGCYFYHFCYGRRANVLPGWKDGRVLVLFFRGGTGSSYRPPGVSAARRGQGTRVSNSTGSGEEADGEHPVLLVREIYSA